MALLAIVALLTGAIVVMVITKVTRLWELILLATWAVLFTVSIYNGSWAEFWTTITAWTK